MVEGSKIKGPQKGNGLSQWAPGMSSFNPAEGCEFYPLRQLNELTDCISLTLAVKYPCVMGA